MNTIKERLDTLESILGQFIVHTDVALRRLENEMKEFKDEMKEFKDEMKEFKDEMKDFKDEMKEETKKKNREWSNLAKKMGTLVEDLIAPALRPVLSKYFNCDVTMEGQRMFRRKSGMDYEVDAIAAGDDAVFMIEVKSTPREKDVDDIVEKSKKFFEFFPEYKDKKLAVIFGSITFPENVITYASRRNVYVMGWREWDYMDILNYDQINKQ
ncbi:MAG TPA: hypothetical protein PLK32_08025 [Defluviitoga tunisiensis]|nr:hypothetical protein [Defluviitoga tunisiensis]